MILLRGDIIIKKSEVLKYTNFRENFKFGFEDLEKSDNKIFFKGELVEDEEKKYPEGENFINIGYNFKNSKSKTLSNLFPIEFKFKGKKVSSIESVLQGIKYKDKKLQNLIFKYSGLDAYHTRNANSLNFWGNDGNLYWQGKIIKRNSKDYQIFLDELFLSVTKNQIYFNSLLASGTKYLLHHIGNDNINETVLTRFEFEQRLNTLREWIKLKR
ncbi:MAG: hypothetical protein IJW82_07630 [Clostridia bacterium]|nr:hypothetical protein [Clostridia bacterium]